MDQSRSRSSRAYADSGCRRMDVLPARRQLPVDGYPSGIRLHSAPDGQARGELDGDRLLHAHNIV